MLFGVRFCSAKAGKRMWWMDLSDIQLLQIAYSEYWLGFWTRKIIQNQGSESDTLKMQAM